METLPFSDAYHAWSSVWPFFQELQCDLLVNHSHGKQPANIGGPSSPAPEIKKLHVMFLKDVPQEEVKERCHLQPSIKSSLFPATVYNILQVNKQHLV